jgi:uncharacterized phage-associated protein
MRSVVFSYSVSRKLHWIYNFVLLKCYDYCRQSVTLRRVGAFISGGRAEVDESGRLIVANALDVAKYLLSLTDDDEPITPLKLQKLLYYAQGASLATNGRSLFQEDLLCWEHGPVVRSVYDHYKYAKGKPLAKPRGFDEGCLSVEDRQLVTKVYNYFGQFTASKLRSMTHEEEPWQAASACDVTVIPTELVRESFTSRWLSLVFSSGLTQDDLFEFLMRNFEPNDAAKASAEKFKKSIGYSSTN